MSVKRNHPVLLTLLLVAALFIAKGINDNDPLTIIRYNRLDNKETSAPGALTLRVNYLWVIPVGTAKLENKGEEEYAGKKVYHLSARAWPLAFYSRFFKVIAEADSYADKAGLYALKFRQSLSLPDKPKDEKEIIYNQDKNFMELDGVKRVILPNTHDPLSAIFYIRSLELTAGQVIDININTNQKNYQLYAKVTGRKEYAFKSGKRAVWMLEGVVRRRDKNPYHKTALKVWLLDDEARTPLLIRTMTSIGPITARLAGGE